MSPRLFIYATGKNGEQTWLVDAYTKLPNGDVELFRGSNPAPVFILSADDVSDDFIVLEW